MCTASPPPGSNPTGRGAGNAIGSFGAEPPSAATPFTPNAPNGAPAGANAVPGTNLSFAEQGYSGVGTPLGTPYTPAPFIPAATPAAPPAPTPAPVGHGTGPVIDPGARTNFTPQSTGPDDPMPPGGFGQIHAPAPVDTGSLYASPLTTPAATPPPNAPTYLPPVTNDVAAPKSVAPATGTGSVTNALMRRYKPTGYY